MRELTQFECTCLCGGTNNKDVFVMSGILYIASHLVLAAGGAAIGATIGAATYSPVNTIAYGVTGFVLGIATPQIFFNLAHYGYGAVYGLDSSA